MSDSKAMPPYSQTDAMPSYPQSDAFPAASVHKQRNRSKDVAIVCLAVGGVMVLSGVANSVQSAGEQQTADAEPARRIVIAETAGGAPRVQLVPEVTAALEQRRSAAAKEGIELHFGGYEHPAGGDAYIIFMGAEQPAADPEQPINDFFAGIAKASGVQAKLTEYPAGDLGGEVRCATTTELRCAWTDRTTYGMVMALDITEADLAALLIKMRPDLTPAK
ncbi:hypothetical protein [Kribbella sp. NPDC023855]|uniref:hypothetical protein n=1 Tax=Kribbella sp. NPDC023855 TaxID=3154698 RepID=UPI00340FBD3E